VNIPAGVDNGTQLRLTQECQPGANGVSGRRFVRSAEGPPNTRFLSVTRAIFIAVPINIGQAALGASIDILTFDGLSDHQDS